MEFYIKVIFCLFILNIFLSIFSICTGNYTTPTSLQVKAADTILISILCIWGGFVLWY